MSGSNQACRDLCYSSCQWAQIIPLPVELDVHQSRVRKRAPLPWSFLSGVVHPCAWKKFMFFKCEARRHSYDKPQGTSCLSLKVLGQGRCYSVFPNNFWFATPSLLLFQERSFQLCQLTDKLIYNKSICIKMPNQAYWISLVYIDDLNPSFKNMKIWGSILPWAKPVARSLWFSVVQDYNITALAEYALLPISLPFSHLYTEKWH